MTGLGLWKWIYEGGTPQVLELSRKRSLGICGLMINTTDIDNSFGIDAQLLFQFLGELGSLRPALNEIGEDFWRGWGIPHTSTADLLDELTVLRWVQGLRRLLGAMEGANGATLRGRSWFESRKEDVELELRARGANTLFDPNEGVPQAKNRRVPGKGGVEL